jgi:hypothetical protein
MKTSTRTLAFLLLTIGVSAASVSAGRVAGSASNAHMAGGVVRRNPTSNTLLSSSFDNEVESKSQVFFPLKFFLMKKIILYSFHHCQNKISSFI